MLSYLECSTRNLVAPQSIKELSLVFLHSLYAVRIFTFSLPQNARGLCSDSLMQLRLVPASICKRLVLPLVLGTLAFSAPASAELGGNVDSVKADHAKMGGALTITTVSGYEVHEIQSAAGIRVREYVAPSGTVFGVAWQGPFKPDLRQLLGPYFDQYVKAVEQGRKTSRGPVTIQLPGLVVQTGGHMRSFAGRAYVPQMIPQAASADAIK